MNKVDVVNDEASWLLMMTIIVCFPHLVIKQWLIDFSQFWFSYKKITASSRKEEVLNLKKIRWDNYLSANNDRESVLDKYTFIEFVTHVEWSVFHKQDNVYFPERCQETFDLIFEALNKKEQLEAIRESVKQMPLTEICKLEVHTDVMNAWFGKSQ